MNATAQILPPSCTLAVDAMGGDHAPNMVMDGIAEAARLHPVASFLVFGDEVRLNPLRDLHPTIADQIIIRHTDVVVPSSERPRNALKSTYKESSLAQAQACAASGEAQACVSAGNTGAMMALGMRHFGLFDGIDRPAFASFMPTTKNETVVLDLGANLTVSAKNLVQFGILGTALSEAMLAMTAPRIGLLNIGTEDTKGHAFVQEADELMRERDWPGSYEGFVEPDGLVDGLVDVLVCDGYAGNIMLKSIEASTKLIGSYTHATFNESMFAKIGFALAGRQFAKLRRRVDPRRYNGAVLAGLQGICVKSHGGGDAVSFTNAIEVAIDLINRSYIKRVPELLATEA